MELSDEELGLLTDTLRHRKKRRIFFWVSTVMALGLYGMLIYVIKPMDLENYEFFEGVLLGALVATGLAWQAGWTDRDREEGLIKLTLRFVNHDPTALKQLSAKRGIGNIET